MFMKRLSIHTSKIHWGRQLAIVAISLVLASLLTLIVNWHRIPLFREGSELYRQYKDREDYEAIFVKALRINDSVTADVTVIMARDSVAWEALQREFNVPEQFIEANRTAKQRGVEGLISFRCEKGHPERRVAGDDKPYDKVFYSTLEKSMYVYDISIKNKKHNFDINEYETNKLLNN